MSKKQRMTQWRADMIASAVASATIAGVKEKIAAEQQVIYAKIVEDRVPAEHRAAYRSLPDAMFPNHHGYYVKVADTSGDVARVKQIHIEGARRHGYMLSDGAISIDKATFEKIEELFDRATAANTLYNDTSKKTRALALTFRNVEDLIESWPTLRDVLPANLLSPPEVVVNLPAPVINELDVALKAALANDSQQEQVTEAA